MKSFTSLLLTVATVLFSASMLMAQGAPAAQKIAVVDLMRVLTQSKQGQIVLDRLDSKQAEKTKQLRTLQLELMDLEDRLRNDRYGLSEAKKTELQGAYEKKALELRRLAGEAEKELGELQSAQFKELEKDVAPILDTIGKEMGIDLILDKLQGGVIFFSTHLDITEDVIKRLDASQAAAAAPAE